MNEYYATHPAYRARKKVTDRLWRESHPEELKEYQADYYQDNKPYLDKQNQDWFDKNYPHALELQRNRVHKYEQKIKIIILKHYSKGKLTCTECGEKNLEFLSIHHVNGRKAAGHSLQMTGARLCRWLIKHNLPKGYDCLCMNCNCRLEYAKDVEIPKQFTDRYQKYYYHTFLPKAELAKQNSIEYYTKGKIRCQCCGEKNIDNLTIDHINSKRIKGEPKAGGVKLWVWLSVNRFPKGFQVLCYNCNSAKGSYGICPHRFVIHHQKGNPKSNLILVSSKKLINYKL